MQLYLIRHAESENNAKPECERVEDPPLTPRGHRQAELLAARVASLKPQVVITSPVRRALQTTRYIVQQTDQHVHVWANLFEEGGIYRGYGPEAIEGGPGLSRQQVIRHLVDHGAKCTLDETINDGGWWGHRDRETSAQATVRATDVARRLADSFGHTGHCVVAITHADFKNKLLIELIGSQPDPASPGELRNTGITKLIYSDGDWQLQRFNCVNHLGSLK